MPNNFIGILLTTTPQYTVNTGFSTKLYDAIGNQTVIVQAGASLTMLGAKGSNTIRLSGNKSDWQVFRDGSTAVLVNTDGSRIELPATTELQTLAFNDGNLNLRIDTSSGSAAVVLGSQVLGTTAVAVGTVSSVPGTVPSVDKTPWTLLASSGFSILGAGVLVSDGTAAGTESKAVGGLSSTLKFLPNAEKTGAYFYDSSSSYWSFPGTSGTGTSVVGYSNGTLSGTLALANSLNGSNYLTTNHVTLVDGKLMLAGDESQQSAAGRVLIFNGLDQSVQTIPVAYRVPTGVTSANPGEAWFTVSTAPYGQELAQLTYAAGQPLVTMVKDINPGSASGFYDSQRVQLPNGRLVFLANDGVHGAELWASDGSDAGTLMLKDISVGLNSSSPEQLTAFGDWVAFVATEGSQGSFFDFLNLKASLNVTDGTPAGTRVVEGLPTSFNVSPIILGQANGLLYFSAVVNGSGNRAVFTSDGTSATRRVDLPSGAQLLGLNEQFGFFKVSDVSNGQELWAADWSAGTFSLVKDVLAGSGSGLASTTGYTAMVGNKIVFAAHVSASQLGLWVSDGTAAGTVNLSATPVLQTVVLGNTLVLTTGNQIYSVDLSVATPVPLLLRSDVTADVLQKDADQVFFRSTSNTLFAFTPGAANPVTLATEVSQYKVVAENAIFFLQNVLTTGGQALWYSDGTVAGTRFIEDVATGTYDLSTAVAIRTAGVPFPLDVIAPVLVRASVSGNALTLNYSDDSVLDAANVPAASAFALTGTTATVSQVSVNASNKTVTLTLSAAVVYGDAIKLSYADPSSGNDVSAIQDAAGNDALSFVQRSVTNKTPDTTAPVFVSAVVNGASLTLTYSDRSSLDSAHAPAASAFTLTGTSATVTGVSVDAANKSVVLTLSASVDSSSVVGVSYTDPTSGNDLAAVQDAAGNDAASLSQVNVVNQTPPKQPWTLFVPSSSGLYASNGTPDGSGWALEKQMYSYSLNVTADQTHAVLLEYGPNPQSGVYEYKMYGLSDASMAPVLLASDVYPYNSWYEAGNTLVFTDPANSSFNALITDGTLEGTTVLADMPRVFVDAARSVLWAQMPSGSSGNELYRAELATGIVTPTLVKDIWPGSSSGLVSGGVSGVVLPNGKLIFTANDGVHGTEPWVSDGTAVGTFMLTDLYFGSADSYIPEIFEFGSQAVLSASVYSPNGNSGMSMGRELVFTDGTVAGTHYLDVLPGYSSSNPTVVGQSHGKLYFVAQASSSQVRSLFSTDGTTFSQLLEINNARILGSNAAQTFFAISDAAHGSELWVFDEATDEISLVKDILVGSGSSLVGDSAVMVGDKLVFSAYTSATQQGLFISDGTSAGTTQLSSTLTFGSFGHTLVFSDASAVFSLDTSLASPTRVSLVSAGGAAGALQSDSNQSFFKLSNGDFYATDGTLSGTVKLAESVTHFKVVAEDAIYLVRGSSPVLAYSDGTASGTYDIEAVSSSVVSGFDQAVVIQTVGVSP